MTIQIDELMKLAVFHAAVFTSAVLGQLPAHESFAPHGRSQHLGGEIT